MVYGWTDESDAVSEWAIVDLHAMRDTGAIDDPSIEGIPNIDSSSSFDAWDIAGLEDLGCIIAKLLTPKQARLL
jgi:hypothetical protein